MPFRRRIHATDQELSAYLDGRAGEVRPRVAEHLEACQECQRALDGLRAVQASLRSLPRPRATRSFVVRENDVRPVPRASGLASAMPMLSGVAAVALIAFFVIVGVDLSGGVSTRGGGGGARLQPASSEQGVPAGDAAAPSGADAEKRAADAEDAFATEAASSNTFALEGNLSLQDAARIATAEAAAHALFAESQQQATPLAFRDEARASDDDDDDTAIRIAEGVLAAVALASGGTAFVLWRRRTA